MADREALLGATNRFVAWSTKSAGSSPGGGGPTRRFGSSTGTDAAAASAAGLWIVFGSVVVTSVIVSFLA